MQFKRGFQHPEGPGINLDSGSQSTAIEPAHVAAALVKAHEPMHFCDSAESGLNRCFQFYR